MLDRPIPTVAIDELKFAAGVCFAAASQRGPYPNPTQYGLEIVDDESGNVNRLCPTDNPLSRGILAVREQFDREKAVALMMRINGLMYLVDDSRMKPYIREVDGAQQMAEVLLEIAAIEPMAGLDGFNADAFFESVGARLGEGAA